MHIPTSSRDRSIVSDSAQVTVLLVLFTIAALYSLVRYGGLWGESDTFTRTGDILSVLTRGQLTPENTDVYPNGFGYQSIVVFLSSLSGLTVAQLQIYGSTMLSILVVIPAWLAYRELTSSSSGATLATAFLFVQPEFLFVIMRGTHEKFTRALMLFCIFLLARSLRTGARPSTIIGFLVSFHMALFSIVTMNNLLANSFVGAFGIAGILMGCTILLRIAPAKTILPILERVVLIAIGGLLMIFLVVFYAYTPSQYSLQFLKDTGNQTVAVVQEESDTVNPYEQINTGWISREVYIAVSIANWILLVASAIIWVWRSWTWLRGHWQPQTSELLLWAFYGAFTAQSALSLVVDLSGAIAGTLQHRIFPSFVMFAAPLAAMWLLQWRPQHTGFSRGVSVALALMLSTLAVLSMLKATNEPLVSNKWLFYLPAESQALAWAEGSLADRLVWTEYDERIYSAIFTRDQYALRQSKLDLFEPSIYTRDFLLSDVTRARAERLGAPLPVEADSLITYDNGQAQVYHLRPRTPYQR